MDFIFWFLIIIAVIVFILSAFVIFRLIKNIHEDNIRQEQMNDIIEKINKGNRK